MLDLFQKSAGFNEIIRNFAKKREELHAKYFHEHFSGKARLSEEFWKTKQKTVAADGVKMEE